MAQPVAGNDPITAPDDERAALSRLVDLLGEGETRVIGAEGIAAPLPQSALRVLREVAEILARGDGAVVTSVGSVITPGQAAELLALPRRYVDTLLDAGTIPSIGAAGKRRIRLTDLLDYRRDEDERREAAMTGLVRMSEELGLYEPEVPAPTRHG